LILPTLEDVWGLVANEGMLCGLPVLCSKYAGCAAELFSAESIFDPQDASEFARKLRDAVTGRLPKPDRSRLRTTPEIVHSMTSAVEKSISHPRWTVGYGVGQ
jgi:glycosyltransferase involved in cell wall biosynthesis